ncbi:arylsulfatase, partial [Streptococcus anginosus]|nr:arylsulfatase [Streptococcus anginosus]
QLKNPDSNYLVSLQSVLANRGYATSFINTEPNNREFSTYLNNMKFGKVVNGTITKGYDATFDKEAYNDLLNQMANQSKD